MSVLTTRPHGANPTVTVDLQALIQRLAALPAGRHRIVSCYVRLEPGDRASASYLIELKDRLKALSQDRIILTLSREARLRVERDLDRIMAYLSHPGELPHTPGVAVFASEALGLFEAVPLPRVHRTRLVVDDTPWISELVAVAAEILPVLTVVIDRVHTRFFQVTALQVTETECLTGPSIRGGRFHSDRGDAPGWGEHGYHGRLEHERHQHYASVAQRVGEIIQQPIRGIVLAGPADHTAALARFFSDPAARRLLGRAALNPTAIDLAQLQSTALALAREHDQQALEVELKALAEAVGSGWAVTGPRETLRALHQGQARTLFIREELEGPGYRCAGSGRLVLAKGECRGEGEPQPVKYLVDECLEEGLRQGVRVIMVPDSPAKNVVDGLAATLRFR